MKTNEATHGSNENPVSAAEKARARKVYVLLEREYPGARPALNFGSPFELLVATILSTQCTDARVNMITPGLFKKYPSPDSFMSADRAELEKHVKSTGFYRQKAKALINASRSLVEKSSGEVPHTMEELLTLDGVGRKTANVLLGNAFGIPGIAVDTHVSRLAQRLGFSQESGPEKIERDLSLLFRKEYWTGLCHLLMAHGRKVCSARIPKCGMCVVGGLCPSAFKLSASSKSKQKKGM